MGQQQEGISRRQFLQASAGLGLGLAGVSTMLRANGKKEDAFGGFTLGVQSYCFRKFDTEPALKKTQELGLHYIEFFQKHAPLNATEDQIKALLKL